MKATIAAKIALLALLIVGLTTASLGCEATSGCADIYLEGATVGSVTIEGKPVTGLPSQKVNIVLKVCASSITISTTGDKTTIKASPSGATVVSGPDGITFTDVPSEQIELKWGTSETTE